MLYLDNSATTAILPEVKDAMLPFLMEEFGNPSSKYYSLATNALTAVKTARINVSKLLGSSSDEIYFTSGSTESNNMILKGVADAYEQKGKHIITSKVEHPSILEVCQYLETKGFRVTYLEVDQFGRISIEDLEASITPETILVTIMWANNEVGSLNDIKRISDLCHEKDVFFHTDATQAVSKIDFKLENYPGITFLSCSAHKFHGPKGTGAVFIKNDQYGIPTKITPLLHGGGQENGLRNGTLAVHNIVGMGKAAEIAELNLENNIKKLVNLEQILTEILLEKFGTNISFNNDSTNKIPGLLSIKFIGLNNEILVKQLAPVIAVSTGSACSSSKPSHVLQAIGLSMGELRSTIRISLSPTSELNDLELFNSL
ncbi:cysteine desulfurase DndA [Bacillus sp. Y1]|nr:aminotransferase class V-fold PLP-dependent enzyme [Bacillus sp. Y1]AYA76005.1 cysteine desulfurase DndA [Bacillus sp. Y1]